MHDEFVAFCTVDALPDPVKIVDRAKMASFSSCLINTTI